MRHSRLLSDLDSNQDPQSQNLRYCRYTIGHNYLQINIQMRQNDDHGHKELLFYPRP